MAAFLGSNGMSLRDKLDELFKEWVQRKWNDSLPTIEGFSVPWDFCISVYWKELGASVNVGKWNFVCLKNNHMPVVCLQ
jgi:hypothetical protein